MKDSIDRPIVCNKCRKYGHHLTECRKREKANKEKDKKEKTKMKQDGVDIKLVTLQDLMTKVKMVKKEIKEDNSTYINEQNIAEIINLNQFSNPMTDPLSLEKDAHNRQNFLSLIDRVIFQKWHTEITLVINKEFSLKEVTLIDSGADMNCIQERLIPLKYCEKSSKRLTHANEEKLIINYKIPSVHICNDWICFETIFVLIKDLSSKIILGNPFMDLFYPFLTTNKGIKTKVLGKDILFKFILPPISKEIYSLDNTSIIKEIDKEIIYRKNKHLLSLK